MGVPRYVGHLSPRTTSQCLVGWSSNMIWAYKMMVVILETEMGTARTITLKTERKEMFLLNV